MARQSSWRGHGDRRILGVVDIGTSKTACFILAVTPGRGAPEAPGAAGADSAMFLGSGLARTQGLKAGLVTNLTAAEASVRVAIAAAEDMAGGVLSEVYVTAGASRLLSLNMTARADVASGVVDRADPDRVLAAVRAFAEREGRTLIDLAVRRWRLDGAPPVPYPPLGLAGRSLAAEAHIGAVDEAVLRNLSVLLERVDIDPAGAVFPPHASALAVTTGQERADGVLVIDLGAGTTGFAILREGGLTALDSIPFGQSLLTYDLARDLSTSPEEAERIKLVYGTLISARSDSREPVAFDRQGSRSEISRAEVREILSVRTTSLIEQLGERLGACGAGRLPDLKVVLTGGGSLLPGLARVVEETLRRPVRLGAPRTFPGTPEIASSPIYSTVTGMALGVLAGKAGSFGFEERSPLTQSYLERVGEWLRESL